MCSLKGIGYPMDNSDLKFTQPRTLVIQQRWKKADEKAKIFVFNLKLKSLKLIKSCTNHDVALPTQHVF